MGFFDFIANTVSNVTSKAAEGLSKAVSSFKKAASVAVDWARDKLLGIVYEPEQITSRVNVGQVLVDFRSSLALRAEETEQDCILKAMIHFDTFAEDLAVYFPEFADLVRIRQLDIKNKLTGVVINYVQIHISENNSVFQVLLEMQPSREKDEKLQDYMMDIIADAEDVFRKKLKKEIKKLNKELNNRLEQKIENEEEQLRSIAEKYENLEKQIANDSLDLDVLESECRPVIEAAQCIQQLLERKEVVL